MVGHVESFREFYGHEFYDTDFSLLIHLRAQTGGLCHLFNLIECEIADTIFLPILIIEVPPLSLVDGKAFGLHRVPQ